MHERQLRLIDQGAEHRLDAATRAIGLAGIAAARRALDEAAARSAAHDAEASAA